MKFIITIMLFLFATNGYSKTGNDPVSGKWTFTETWLQSKIQTNLDFDELKRTLIEPKGEQISSIDKINNNRFKANFGMGLIEFTVETRNKNTFICSVESKENCQKIQLVK